MNSIIEETVPNSASPKVSVCIPVYNGSDYIAEAIESVLSQSYKDFQLIVSDNCSTDNTGEIVRGFNDSRIMYIRNKKNLGQTGNVNQCLELAEGEYICIFHHDDMMLYDNLARKVSILDNHPEVGFVHSNIILIDPDGEVVDRNIWSKDSRRDYIEDGLSVLNRYLEYLPLGASIFIGAVLARRASYDHVGGFSREIPNCDDSEMWMRMMLFYNVACIGLPLVKYRVHPVSASSKWGNYTSVPYLKEHYKAKTILFDKYKDQIPQANNLRRQVSLSFSERALQLAANALVSGDYENARGFFKLTVIFSPWILKKFLFWKTSIGLLFGPKGISVYQTFKKNIIKN